MMNEVRLCLGDSDSDRAVEIRLSKVKVRVGYEKINTGLGVLGLD